MHFFSPDRGDCRSREMLQNEYLVAKIGFDTAENGQCGSRSWYMYLKEPLYADGVLAFHTLYIHTLVRRRIPREVSKTVL